MSGYTWRMGLSTVARSMMPMPLQLASRLTGGWLNRGMDRMFGATDQRNAYNAARGGGGAGLTGAPLPGWMAPGAPMGQGRAPGFNNPLGWIGSWQPQPQGGQQHGYYGSGQGMMRAPAQRPTHQRLDRAGAIHGMAAQDMVRGMAHSQIQAESNAQVREFGNLQR
jgi:hypothetical protein